ncbi:aminopeptidase 2, partial [Rozella allomycis CSF55]
MVNTERDILPSQVKPYHYDLHLTPDLQKHVFSGRVWIHFDVHEATNSVSVNAHELKILKAGFMSEKGGEMRKAKETKYDRKKQVLETVFEEKIEKGAKGVLYFEFEGILNDKMAGFYRSAYTDENGAKKFMAVTQFEATDARRAFPCFDEPALKATFSITMQVEKEITALSNMNVVEMKDVGEGKVDVVFAKTPVMSTYLVAFAAGEFDFTETETKEGVKVRVYTLKGQKELGRFALDVGAKTLSYFTEYFDMPYPLPKLDMIAIPDFAAGAMENWGLVTFRSIYLLFDEEKSSLRAKQNVAYVVGHELAHQWFGNLVTMDWWQDLWLNEGFATWVGWLAVDFIFPEWEIWLGFINDEQQRGLALDSLRSSHPIEVPVKNPDEISQIFDAISYSKGASVIRQLVAYLGEEVFKKGIRSYLKKHKFGNAATRDLWKSLEETSGEPVEEMMKFWTRQIGFPLISVREGNKANEILIEQHRYLSTGDVKPVEDKDLWFVPLGISSMPKTTQNSNLLTTKSSIIEISENIENLKFLKLNVNQSGFYRVKYSDSLLEKIKNNFSELSKFDKIGFLADSFALAVSGNISTTKPLSLLNLFSIQDGFIIWSEIAQRIQSVKDLLWQEPESVKSKCNQFIQNLFGSIYDKLGFEFNKSDDDLTILLRNLAISMAGKAGHPEIVEKSKIGFNKFINGDESALHPSIIGSVFSIVVKFGSVVEYEQVLKIYKETQIQDRKLAALSALGSPKTEDLLQKTLQFALSDEIRSQDVVYPIGSVAGNPYGRLLAFKFLQDNWDALYKRYYGGSAALLGRIVQACVQDLASDDFIRATEMFFKDKDISSISRFLQQAIEKAKVSAAWLKRDAKAIES